MDDSGTAVGSICTDTPQLPTVGRLPGALSEAPSRLCPHWGLGGGLEFSWLLWRVC